MHHQMSNTSIPERWNSIMNFTLFVAFTHFYGP